MNILCQWTLLLLKIIKCYVILLRIIMTFYTFDHIRATLTRFHWSKFKIMQGHSKMTSLRCPSDPHDHRIRGGGGGAGFNQTGIFLKVVIFFGHLLKITKKKELKTTRKNLEQQSPQPIVSVEKMSTIWKISACINKCEP